MELLLKTKTDDITPLIIGQKEKYDEKRLCA